MEENALLRQKVEIFSNNLLSSVPHDLPFLFDEFRL